MTLVYKRYQETPKRKWQIWLMDSTKQGLAMGLQHFVNIFLAVMFATGKTQASECIWYGANFFIAVVCGLFILTQYMRAHRWAVEKYASGASSAAAEKFLTAVVVIVPLHFVIDVAIARLEVPFKPYPKFELVFVMVLLPIALNAIFAWIVDNLIKDPSLKEEMEGVFDPEYSEVESEEPATAIFGNTQVSRSS
eukprot:CAMPEP_0180698254 /NCGR_PEP_ID=MMETSP1038_2-20121128/3927_1 /TAXON_ID=632150 /ORGANISM="Azadinium spinosum, Strain 3D9" /LENGTH=193 /DNA_ID=CAMNT_0022729813 /DNA_START=65 /DNA_END=645 /DNA_ORIENTATION=-